MILRVDGAVYRGRAVTVRTDVDPETIAEAVRQEDADEDGTVTVRAQQPHPVHERVGCIYPGMGLRARTALADAARARGLSTAHNPALRAARERLREVSVTGVDATDQRRAVADASSETERLRERVAETRGRLAARREFDRETDALAAELEDAARELSEAETSAAAARQSLDQRRREARNARSEWERQMRLEDELANCRRRTRAALIERTRGAFERAVAAAPGGPDEPDDPFEVDPVTAGLAIARVASLSAPVVLSCDRFADAAAASAWLDAPVVRLC